MKKLFYFGALSLLLSFTGYAQQRSCGSQTAMDERMQNDPSYRKMMNDMESATQKRIQKLNSTTSRVVNGTYFIPVVVHVIYNNAQGRENISNAQIKSQIDVINEDFGRYNSDRNNLWRQASGTGIQFELAGITRTLTKHSNTWADRAFEMVSTVKDNQGKNLQGIDPWNTNEYLNIWVVGALRDFSRTPASETLGIASFPNSNSRLNGVVIEHNVFGRVGTLNSTYNKGRTLTHEIGHYFNLRHIWGSGSNACNVDDLVGDTPNAKEPHYACGTYNTCGSRDMSQNYMDYGNDNCLNLFTKGQRDRMRATFLPGGGREKLGKSNKTGKLVVMKKGNFNFGIDGNWGGKNFQPVYIWSHTPNNVNQKWVEIDRGNGFYSYRKFNTDFCMDGGNGGRDLQRIYLYQTSDNNQNQHWKKVRLSNGKYRLFKRNAPKFAIDGNWGATNGQPIYLYTARSNNVVNQTWTFSSINGNRSAAPQNTEPITKLPENINSTTKFTMFPNPSKGRTTFNIAIEKEGEVSLNIYDINGRQIANVFNGNKEVGTHNFTWNPEGKTKGIYFVKLQTPDTNKSFKLVLN